MDVFADVCARSGLDPTVPAARGLRGALLAATLGIAPARRPAAAALARGAAVAVPLQADRQLERGGLGLRGARRRSGTTTTRTGLRELVHVLISSLDRKSVV